MPIELATPAQALAAALRLASRGVPVFPCSLSKAPACPHGHLDATDIPAAIADLWRRYPGPLVGIPTGPASGFNILDIDAPRHPEAAEWWARHRDRIPPTRINQTRSGGLHVMFGQFPEVRNSAGRIAPGIDVRGNGGFIIWWPAAGFPVLDRSETAPWPDWLLRQVLPPVEATPLPMRQPPFDMVGDAGRQYALAALRRGVERVASTQEGSRNDALNAEAFALARFIPLGLTAAEVVEALAIAARCAGLSARETAATLASALRARSGN